MVVERFGALIGGLLFLNSKVNVVVTRHSKLLTVNFCKRNLDIGIEPPRIGRAQNFWWISW